MRTDELISVLIFLGIVITVYVVELYLILQFIADRLKNRQAKSELVTKPKIFIHILALIGVICFLYSCFIEPYWIEVSTVNIVTEKLRNTNLRIIQISDLHCDKKVRNENKLVDIINPLKPDIIVFTGDTLNSAEALSLFKATMKKLKAEMGKFAVSGNYDFWLWRKLDLFNNTDFKLLDKETIRLTKDKESFFISGLGYGDSNDWYGLLKDVPSDYYSIFLYHTPDLIEDLKGANVDLYLSGHTHGGQIRIPFYGALLTLTKVGKKYAAGKYTVNKAILYVNRGIGMEGGSIPRVRFWCRPEITIFNIKPKK